MHANHPELFQRNPLFRNFLFATTISLIGTCIFDIAMPLYVLQRTHSVVALSLISIALTLPFFVLAPVTGYVVDHFNKRNIMLFSDLAQVLAMLFLLTYELSDKDSLWPILITVFAAKSLMILFETVTTFQLIPAMVNPNDLSNANLWFLSSHRIIQIAGPLLGGFLMAGFGIKSCILVNVLSFGATLYFTFRITNLDDLIMGEDRHLEKHRHVSFRKMFADFRASIRYVWQSPIFRPFVALMFLWNLSPLTPNAPTLTYYFTEAHHFGPEKYGIVVSLFGVLGILGFIQASKIYNKHQFAAAFERSAFWQAVAATSALAFIPYPALLAITFGISRVGSSVLTLGTFLLRQSYVPKRQTGTVNTTIRMFFMSAAPVSAILQAFLIQNFGVASSLVLGAICLWGTAWYARRVSLAFQQQHPEFAKEKAA